MNKTNDFHTWVNETTELLDQGVPETRNAVAHTEKRIRTLQGVYEEHRNWWKNDIAQDQLRHGHTLHKKLKALMQECEAA